MNLDSHQHFWSYNEREYPWIPKGTALHRDWLPADLTALQQPLGIGGTISVQARQTLGESRWLLTLADHDPRIKGVVGWVDLQSPDIEIQLTELSQHPRFRGVRHVVQDESDEGFMQRPEFRRGIQALKAFSVTYDLLIRSTQLTAATELVREFPEQPFVLDHLAKPPIKAGLIEPWKRDIRELAKASHVMCKVSGMVTEADHRGWKATDLRPYLDVVFDCFGPERLMWGSDWPVCLLAADYGQVLAVVEDFTRALDSVQRDALFGGNCAKFYGIR